MLNDHSSSSVVDVSVVVVSWNLLDLLRNCLEHIRCHHGSLSIETIVVDNGSSDGAVEMIERDFPEVRLIRNESNLGFSHASNQGMEVATGRYIILLNNDALLFKDALPRLVQFMDSHPDAGSCGPRVINRDGTLQVRSKGFYPSIPRALSQFFIPRFWGLGSRANAFYISDDSTEVREVDWLCGCALMARREAVEAVGLLDEEVFMCLGYSYCEDIDWCYRMSHAGWKVMYVPEAVVLHYGGETMKKLKGKVVAAHAIGLMNFFSKYHGRSSSLVFKLIISVGYAVKAVGWLAGALVGRGAGFDKLRRLIQGRRSRLS